MNVCTSSARMRAACSAARWPPGNNGPAARTNNAAPRSRKRPAARTRIAVAIVATLGLVGCDETLRDVTGPSPNLVPTFDSVNQEIFLTTDGAGRTGCVNCHTGRIPNISINFSPGVDSYALMVNVPSRQRPDLMLVAPGDPDNSYLIHKLEGRSGIVGLRMPRNGPPFLTDGQLRVLRRWIELGAPR
jgi:hypothetical protein